MMSGMSISCMTHIQVLCKSQYNKRSLRGAGCPKIIFYPIWDTIYLHGDLCIQPTRSILGTSWDGTTLGTFPIRTFPTSVSCFTDIVSKEICRRTQAAHNRSPYVTVLRWAKLGLYCLKKFLICSCTHWH